MTCSVNGCGGTVRNVARGLCNKHYLRLMRHGTTDMSIDKTRGPHHPLYKHGESQLPGFKTWDNMMGRCYNPKQKGYEHYGGRGIIVCPEWHTYKGWAADMLPQPMGLTLDRINGDGNYEPSNCRWASRTLQSRNRKYVKLSEADAFNIRLHWAERIRRKTLAENFGVSEATIKKVVSGAYWRESESETRKP